MTGAAPIIKRPWAICPLIGQMLTMPLSDWLSSHLSPGAEDGGLVLRPGGEITQIVQCAFLNSNCADIYFYIYLGHFFDKYQVKRHSVIWLAITRMSNDD